MSKYGIDYDKDAKRYIYRDKNGAEIHRGDYVRYPLGSVEHILEWEDSNGNKGFGTDATNHSWLKNGRAYEGAYGVYPLTWDDVSQIEVIDEKIGKEEYWK